MLSGMFVEITMICGGVEKWNNKIMDAISKSVTKCEWLEDFPNLEYWSSHTCWIYEVELGNFYSHLKEEKCIGGVFGLETPIGVWWCYRLEQQLEEGGECIYWVLFHDC